MATTRKMPAQAQCDALQQSQEQATKESATLCMPDGPLQ